MKNCPVCGMEMTKPESPLPGEVKDHSISGEVFLLKECKSCELLHTDIAEELQLEKYYLSNDYVSHGLKYLNPVHVLYALARNFTLRSKRKLAEEISNGKTILDYGCGTGEFLDFMTKSGWNTNGYEPSETALKASAYKEIINLTGNTQHIPGNNNVITLWHVLEHTKNPVTTLKELKEKMAVAGKIIIAVPNYQSYDSQFYGIHWAAYDVPRHLWHFSAKSINSLANSTGLKVIKKVPMKLDSYYVSLLSEKYLNKNKQSIFTYFRAFRKGFTSNRKAAKTGSYSSIIYILSE